MSRNPLLETGAISESYQARMLLQDTVLSKEFLEIQANTKCRLTLKSGFICHRKKTILKIEFQKFNLRFNIFAAYLI